MEKGEADEESKKKTPMIIIGIPSYEEVIGSTQEKSAPPSLFTPSESFSQAFAFIKSTEFYSPPAALPARKDGESSVPSAASPASACSNISRQVGEASSSGAATAPAVSSSNSNKNRNAILVSHRQKFIPTSLSLVDLHVHEEDDIVCDYLLGKNSCALYLSLRYHLLHPDYLYYRIRELQRNFKLRIVLCHVDVEDAVKALLEVTKTALLHDCTLLCAWSLEECGRYLETIKVYENKPADLIQGQMDTDYLSRLNHALTTVRHVNKTDVITLGSTFASLSNIMDASMEDLARCPGIGERKVKRLYDTFHEPFKRVAQIHPPLPETSIKKDAEQCCPREVIDLKDSEDVRSKQRNKEPELNVKSALSAAFSRYADKINRRNSIVVGSEAGDGKT